MSEFPDHHRSSLSEGGLEIREILHFYKSRILFLKKGFTLLIAPLMHVKGAVKGLIKGVKKLSEGAGN